MTSSGTDTTPLLLIVQSDIGDYNDVLNWYKWDQTSSQFSSVKSYELEPYCGIAYAASSSTFLLDASNSPNKHPLLFFGCTSRSPLVLDLWTLDLKFLQANDAHSYSPSRLTQFWYNKATPTTIWARNENYNTYGWDITSLKMTSASQIPVFRWSSDVVSIGSSILISDEDGTFGRLRQWDAANFIKGNVTSDEKYMVIVPSPQVFGAIAVSAATKIVYAFGRQYPAFDTCTGGYAFSVVDKPVSFDKSVPCFSDQSVAAPFPYGSVVVDEKKTVVLASYHGLTLSLLNLDLTVIASIPIRAPINYSANFEDIITVPDFAKKVFGFDFVVLLALYPPRGGVLAGSMLSPYIIKV